MARKQVHLLMPEELHALVKAKADDCGVSLTAYVLSVLEKDLNTQAGNGSSLASLALRVRAIEVHLGLDSRPPGLVSPDNPLDGARTSGQHGQAPPPEDAAESSPPAAQMSGDRNA